MGSGVAIPITIQVFKGASVARTETSTTLTCRGNYRCVGGGKQEEEEEERRRSSCFHIFISFPDGNSSILWSKI